MNSEKLYKNKIDKAEKYFLEGYACSQSVLMAFCDELGMDMETAKRISSTFGGGMGRLRKTCGALTGAFMVIGLKYGNVLPDDMKAKMDSYAIVRELVARFEKKHGTSECKELLMKYSDEKTVEDRGHHKAICRDLVADAVEMLLEICAEKDRK